MSKGNSQLFQGTKGAQIISISTTKYDAINSVNTYPSNIQANAKRFYKGSSDKYDRFEVIRDNDDNYRMGMRKPGNVPGSYAIYYKVVSPSGETVRAYKETYDPTGNLVHTKEKIK